MIKHANFQLFRAHPDIATNTLNDVCFKSNVLRRKNCKGVITRKFLYKSVEAHTSANAYGSKLGSNKTTIRNAYETKKSKKLLKRNFKLCVKIKTGFFKINI